MHCPMLAAVFLGCRFTCAHTLTMPRARPCLPVPSPTPAAPRVLASRAAPSSPTLAGIEGAGQGEVSRLGGGEVGRLGGLGEMAAVVVAGPGWGGGAMTGLRWSLLEFDMAACGRGREKEARRRSPLVIGSRRSSWLLSWRFGETLLSVAGQW